MSDHFFSCEISSFPPLAAFHWPFLQPFKAAILTLWLSSSPFYNKMLSVHQSYLVKDIEQRRPSHVVFLVWTTYKIFIDSWSEFRFSNLTHFQLCMVYLVCTGKTIRCRCASYHAPDNSSDLNSWSSNQRLIPQISKSCPKCDDCQLSHSIDKWFRLYICTSVGFRSYSVTIRFQPSKYSHIYGWLFLMYLVIL